MNLLVHIFSRMIGALNALIERTPRKTAETIRQSFFLLTAVLLIVAVIIGHQIGKKSARKMGTQIAGETNDVFDIDIKLEKRGGDFRSMLDSELLSEIRESTIKKRQFPVQGRLEPETGDGIIEPPSLERAISPMPDLDLRDRISEPARTDDVRAASDVKNLRRRDPYPGLGEKPEVLKDERTERVLKPGTIEGDDRVPPPPTEKPLVREDSAPSEKQAPGPVKELKRRPAELRPIQKDTGIIAK
ncbi:MAG TPA: hypothetical protein VLM75_02430 [Spirochaetota bacterium]|nr:hypothetical protein [Spirochaetota bacterium]